MNDSYAAQIAQALQQMVTELKQINAKLENIAMATRGVRSSLR